MKRILMITCIVALLLVSCSSETNLQGTWHDKNSDQVLTFDGNVCTFGDFKVQVDVSESQIVMKFDDGDQTYNYVHLADDLTISIPDVEGAEIHYQRVEN